MAAHALMPGEPGVPPKVDGKALPQYFLMVGGGMARDGAHFARLAAKIPARRVDSAVERLIDLFRSERETGETATSFFRRVDLGRVREILADLETVRPGEATPVDFVDLGDQASFEITTVDGECSA
jgi:sulfite reductase beta subunit-like hemoprotein